MHNLVILFFTSAASGVIVGVLSNLPKVGKIIVLLAFVAVALGASTDPTYLAKYTAFLWYEWVVYLSGLVIGAKIGEELLEEILQEWRK